VPGPRDLEVDVALLAQHELTVVERARDAREAEVRLDLVEVELDRRGVRCRYRPQQPHRPLSLRSVGEASTDV
jgi:hypothetical protein